MPLRPQGPGGVKGVQEGPWGRRVSKISISCFIALRGPGLHPTAAIPPTAQWVLSRNLKRDQHRRLSSSSTSDSYLHKIAPGTPPGQNTPWGPVCKNKEKEDAHAPPARKQGGD